MANLIITINDTSLDEFREKYLAKNPKPYDFDGTNLDWVKYNIRKNLMSIYRKGKSLEGYTRDETMITY